jgi:DNA-binding FadR family transcriptional regulator
MLNISRVTLRDALRSLQESGYVESRPGRNGGTFVLRSEPADRRHKRPARPSAAEAQDVLDLRWIIERGACEFAAKREQNAYEQAALRAAVDDCAKADLRAYRRLDSRLHLMIAELSGVPSLAALAAENRERLNHVLDCFPLLPPNLVHSNRQHVRIVNAILRGDAVSAVTEMERHMRGTASLINGFLA